MNVSTHTSSDGSVATITVQGTLGFNGREAFEDAYESLATLPRIYEIDLDAVDYMDSSGMGLLLILREDAESHGASVRLLNCQPGVASILEIAKLDAMFEVRPSA